MALLLLLTACTPKEDAAAALSVTPAAIDLGDVADGESASADIVLANSGGGSLDLLSASLVSGDTRAWSVERVGFDPLADGVTTTLTVTFSPDDEGASPAQIQVRSTDPANPSVYVPLAATGAPSTADDDGDGFSRATGDCDDDDPDAFPGATEYCDGRDDDCDGTVPANEGDDDGDGVRLCDDDCDDADAAVYPGAREICDGKDSDCDGDTPDDADEDGDGYTICDDDCDDAEPAAHPGGVELCDGIDNDCTSFADDLDADGDGASLCGDVPDCDDTDPTAYPLFVDPGYDLAGTGTLDDPFTTIADALAALDDTCRTIGLAPGTYADAITWSDGDLRFVGLADAENVVFTPAEGERSFAVAGGALTLESLTLTGGAPADGDGGAIAATDADISLVGVTLTANTSPSDGGAVSLVSGTLSLFDCTLSDNVAGDDGGAVAIVSADLLDGASTWSGNTASQGGALFAVSSTVTLDTVTFDTNAAGGDGGGMSLDTVTAWVDRAVFIGNTAVLGGGGAAIDGLADGWIRNTRFLGNTADDGGGLTLATSAAGVVANDTFVGNTATGDGAGVAVTATDAAALYFWSNILAWNDGASGLYVGIGAAPSLADNLAYATTSGTDFDLPAALTPSGHLVEDPRFTTFTNDDDPTDDDLTLTARSPAVDSGPLDGTGPEATMDWDDVDGTRNDRGYTGGPGGW